MTVKAVPQFKRLALLMDESMIIRDNTTGKCRQLIPAPGAIETLYNQAKHYKIDQVWILPGDEIGPLLANQVEYLSPNQFTFHTSKNEEGQPTYTRFWATEGASWEDKRTLEIVWPGHDVRWPWATCDDGATLFKAVLYARDALQIDIAWGPGHVGRELIKETNQGPRKSWIAFPGAFPQEIGDTLAHDLRFRWHEMAQYLGLYLHVVDKNSMYLGAATGAHLGQGQPTRAQVIDASIIDAARNFTQPGLWTLSIESAPPGIFSPYGLGKRLKLWSPEVGYLNSTGHHLKFEAAWLWEHHHQTLRPWADRLWNARQALKFGGPVFTSDNTNCLQKIYTHEPARQLAYESIKDIATQGLGWLAIPPKGSYNQGWYRPDWWSMVVSLARARLMNTISNLIALECPVVWVDVDSIGFVSPNPSLVDAMPGLLNPNKLGGYKHVYSGLIDDETVAAFNGNLRDVQTYVNARKGI